jgi:phosphomevalonate kinase
VLGSKTTWLNISRSESDTRNPFVETTLAYVLTYLHHLPIEPVGDLCITILADDDYYSHTRSSRKGSFSKFDVSLADVHKTGLGSSAALVTALTAALLVAFLPDASPAPLSSNQDVIHNLAQASHCAAQGKVGSGFDVAAAVYGSCLYRRFTPSILEQIGEVASDGFGERLHRCVENLDSGQRWDTEVLKQAVQIPRSLRLVMCDVDCGSQTPGMVKKVLTWRQGMPEEANLLWSALQQGTEDLCEELKRLAQLNGITAPKYQNLRDIISTIRSLVREMSDKSGVPIEPPLQTDLLDACSAIPGVLGGLVPGAGGYDAIVVLVEDNEKALANLQNLLDGWKGRVEQGSSVTMGKVSLLGVKQAVQGIRVEPAETFASWI